MDVEKKNTLRPSVMLISVDALKPEFVFEQEKRGVSLPNITHYFLEKGIAVKEGIITLEDVKNILNDAFSELNFDNLVSIKFVGDGTYLQFTDKYVEIRPSGTDAKTKAYAGGENLAGIENYARVLGNYSGERTAMHRKLVSDEFYESSKEKALNYYLQFVDKDANNEVFVIPEYKF